MNKVQGLFDCTGHERQNLVVVMGAIQVLHNTVGVGGVKFSGGGGMRCECVRFNVINYRYKRWGGVNFPEKSVT